MKINLSDISVVVQGPIVTKEGQTARCLTSIRQHIPNAKIILSTWKGSDVSGLDFDDLVESNDPGYVSTVLDSFEPDTVRSDSANRQIVSTLAGLRKCETRYAIKMRSDLLITHSGFLDYFERYADLPTDNDYQILPVRILALTTCNPNRRHKFPFTLPDWFIFGETKSLINIFAIPLIDIKGGYRVEKRGDENILHTLYSTEQYIWCSFLKKYENMPFRYVNDTNQDTISLSEKYFANNCILLPAKQAGIDWLKYPRAAYAQVPALSNTGLYTWNEYQHLLNRYANCSLSVPWNPIENLIYFIVYNSRYIIKNISPSLHNSIVKIINPNVHKKLNMIELRVNDK